MKHTLPLVLMGLFLSPLSLAGQGAPADTGCEFTLDGSPATPSFEGPEDVVSIARLIPQPDSPIEVLSIDFEGSFLSIGRSQTVWEPQCNVKVRNRSDRRITKAYLSIDLGHRHGSAWVGGDGVQLSQLAPGEEITFSKLCGGRGVTSGPSEPQLDDLAIDVLVDWVDFEGCRYFPSIHYSKRLILRPPKFRIEAWVE